MAKKSSVGQHEPSVQKDQNARKCRKQNYRQMQKNRQTAALRGLYIAIVRCCCTVAVYRMVVSCKEHNAAVHEDIWRILILFPREGMATHNRLGSTFYLLCRSFLWSCVGKQIARRQALVSFVESRPARGDFSFDFVSAYLAFVVGLLFCVAVFCVHRSGVLSPPNMN